MSYNPATGLSTQTIDYTQIYTEDINVSNAIYYKGSLLNPLLANIVNNLSDTVVILEGNVQQVESGFANVEANFLLLQNNVNDLVTDFGNISANFGNLETLVNTFSSNITILQGNVSNLETNKVSKAGDTMTGQLIIDYKNISLPEHIYIKEYNAGDTTFIKAENTYFSKNMTIKYNSAPDFIDFDTNNNAYRHLINGNPLTKIAPTQTDFYKKVIINEGINMVNYTPSTTTDMLYYNGSNLYFNGKELLDSDDLTNINSNILSNLQTAKTYTDDNINSNVATLNSSISTNLATAKQYTDDNINSNVATLNSSISTNLATAKQYTDDNINSNVATLNSSISTNLATAKQYTDDNINSNVATLNSAINGKVSDTGDTMTGQLIIDYKNVSLPEHIYIKEYNAAGTIFIKEENTFYNKYSESKYNHTNDFFEWNTNTTAYRHSISGTPITQIETSGIDFYKKIIANEGIEMVNYTPATTANMLYYNGTELLFNGNTIGGDLIGNVNTYEEDGTTLNFTFANNGNDIKTAKSSINLQKTDSSTNNLHISNQANQDILNKFTWYYNIGSNALVDITANEVRFYFKWVDTDALGGVGSGYYVSAQWNIKFNGVSVGSGTSYWTTNYNNQYISVSGLTTAVTSGQSITIDMYVNSTGNTAIGEFKWVMLQWDIQGTRTATDYAFYSDNSTTTIENDNQIDFKMNGLTPFRADAYSFKFRNYFQNTMAGYAYTGINLISPDASNEAYFNVYGRLNNGGGWGIYNNNAGLGNMESFVDRDNLTVYHPNNIVLKSNSTLKHINTSNQDIFYSGDYFIFYPGWDRANNQSYIGFSNRSGAPEFYVSSHSSSATYWAVYGCHNYSQEAFFSTNQPRYYFGASGFTAYLSSGGTIVTSDRRIKTNIQDANEADVRELITNVKLKTYDIPLQKSTNHIGFVSQDLPNNSLYKGLISEEKEHIQLDKTLSGVFNKETSIITTTEPHNLIQEGEEYLNHLRFTIEGNDVDRYDYIFESIDEYNLKVTLRVGKEPEQSGDININIISRRVNDFLFLNYEKMGAVAFEGVRLLMEENRLLKEQLKTLSATVEKIVDRFGGYSAL